MDKEERDKNVPPVRAKESKQELISHSWDLLKNDGALSLKEKLEKLLALAREAKKPQLSALSLPKNEAETNICRITGFKVFENCFSAEFAFGKVRLGSGLKITGEVLALLSHDMAFRELDLSTALFLDLETTGLSGGVGVIPFLVGVGFFEGENFTVRQFFLGELAAEEAMMSELDRFFQTGAFRSVISFNGKSFDLPILETRFTLYRLPLALLDLPHLDFIFPARHLWKHKHESCRLSHLAQQVISANRWEDIPASEVPLRYFSYLRTGDLALIEPVLEHNQLDLLSLLGIIIAAAEIVGRGEETEEIDGLDLLGLARILESAGQTQRSFELLEMALNHGIPESLSIGVKRKLAWHWKRCQRWEKAVAIWQDLAPLGKLYCFRELAMYYEHRLRDYERASEVAREGLSVAQGVSKIYEQDFRRRLERLREKKQKIKVIK